MKNPVRFGHKLGATKWELQVIILDFLESNGILSKYLRKIGVGSAAPAANSKQLLDKRPESLSWLNNPWQATNFYSLAPKKRGKNFILE